MRKIILNLALSLDGYIEGNNGEYDWCFDDQDYGLSTFFEQIDSLLMGRKSYETLKSAGDHSFDTKHKYIVSRTLQSSSADETILGGDFISEIRKLQTQSGGDIWLFGGAQLFNELLKEELIDEFQLSIHPLLLGGGTRLYLELDRRLHLELVKCEQFSSGLVQLHYRPKKTELK